MASPETTSTIETAVLTAVFSASVVSAVVAGLITRFNNKDQAKEQQRQNTELQELRTKHEEELARLKAQIARGSAVAQALDVKEVEGIIEAWKLFVLPVSRFITIRNLLLLVKPEEPDRSASIRVISIEVERVRGDLSNARRHLLENRILLNENCLRVAELLIQEIDKQIFLHPAEGVPSRNDHQAWRDHAESLNQAFSTVDGLRRELIDAMKGALAQKAAASVG
jgi:hypothetical protein